MPVCIDLEFKSKLSFLMPKNLLLRKESTILKSRKGILSR